MPLILEAGYIYRSWTLEVVIVWIFPPGCSLSFWIFVITLIDAQVFISLISLLVWCYEGRMERDDHHRAGTLQLCCPFTDIQSLDPNDVTASQMLNSNYRLVIVISLITANSDQTGWISADAFQINMSTVLFVHPLCLCDDVAHIVNTHLECRCWNTLYAPWGEENTPNKQFVSQERWQILHLSLRMLHSLFVLVYFCQGEGRL